jgi:hypothetical protein
MEMEQHSSEAEADDTLKQFADAYTEGEGYERDDESEEEEEQIFEPLPERPRVPSIVPLASVGKSRAVVDTQFERERAEIARLEAEIQQLNVPVQGPSQAEINAQVASRIAKERAMDARQAIHQSATSQFKNQKIGEKIQADFERHSPDHLDNVRVMTSYKEKFNKKIKFAFRAKYHADIAAETLAKERLDCENVLSTRDAPQRIKAITQLSAGYLSQVFILLGCDPVKFNRLEEKMKHSLYKTAEFDEEIEQLAIIYGGWFAMSPEKRFLFKYAGVIFDCATADPRTFSAPGGFEDL